MFWFTKISEAFEAALAGWVYLGILGYDTVKQRTCGFWNEIKDCMFFSL